MTDDNEPQDRPVEGELDVPKTTDEPVVLSSEPEWDYPDLGGIQSRSRDEARPS